ncbi:cytochrome P450 [Dacryopinax primogenitus]|uniref:Cytochrome P450 n=1 Tax=Dacryopinax primogenitus (strain DJM 731) TaxID=1858805 RepID=M5FTY8_DACPD|nr:cytochrome P450 [Dacryopinax primogenitus]EJT98939.1 cytochrome P450 [Dacryopinax primogenitus]
MELHKHYRRMFTQALGSRAIPSYWEIQIQEMRRAVLEMLRHGADDERWLKSIRRAVSSVTSRIVYGLRSRQKRMLHRQAGRPGEYIVEGLPFLKYLPSWFPGASFKRIGMQIRQDCQELVDDPFNTVKQSLHIGKPTPCFVSHLLVDEQGDIIEDPQEEERIKWAAGVLWGGGVDTTVAAIQMFLTAILLFPSAQLKAQQEIDRVVGPDRMPTLEDRNNLPYCTAMVQELLRWNPVVPLCIPHVLIQDESYDGWILPKGSIVIPNSWALAQDPIIYEEPSVVNPDRFLSEDSQTLFPREDGREVVGFGRRICPGNHLAEATIFAFVCTFVWSSNLQGTSDWDGSEPEYGGGIVK